MSLLSFINDWKRLDIKYVENSDRQMSNWGYGVGRCKDIKWTYPEKSQKHSMKWLMSRVKLYNVKHLIRYGRNWSLSQTIITSAVRRLCMEEWRRPIRPDHLWRRISERSSVTTYDLWFPMTKRYKVEFIKFVSEQSRIFQMSLVYLYILFFFFARSADGQFLSKRIFARLIMSIYSSCFAVIWVAIVSMDDREYVRRHDETFV